MREPYRLARPVVRLLIVALGLLGFVVGPGGAAPPGGTSRTGSITSGTVQQAPARTRDPADDRKRPARTRSSQTQATRAQVAPTQVLVAFAKAAPAHPSNAAHAPSAALSASGVVVRPPSRRVARAVTGLPTPDVPSAGAPRGRAPPTSPRI